MLWFGKRNYVHFLYLHKENEPKESAPQTLSRWLPSIFPKVWRLLETHVASDIQT